MHVAPSGECLNVIFRGNQVIIKLYYEMNLISKLTNDLN